MTEASKETRSVTAKDGNARGISDAADNIGKDDVLASDIVKKTHETNSRTGIYF